MHIWFVFLNALMVRIPQCTYGSYPSMYLLWSATILWFGFCWYLSLDFPAYYSGPLLLLWIGCCWSYLVLHFIVTSVGTPSVADIPCVWLGLRVCSHYSDAPSAHSLEGHRTYPNIHRLPTRLPHMRMGPAFLRLGLGLSRDALYLNPLYEATVLKARVLV